MQIGGERRDRRRGWDRAWQVGEGGQGEMKNENQIKKKKKKARLGGGLINSQSFHTLEEGGKMNELIQSHEKN